MITKGDLLTSYGIVHGLELPGWRLMQIQGRDVTQGSSATLRLQFSRIGGGGAVEPLAKSFDEYINQNPIQICTFAPATATNSGILETTVTC